MRTLFLTLLSSLLLSNAALADAASAAAKPEAGVSAVLPSTRQFDFKSGINGRSYRVQVAIPFVPAPQQGYATLYLLDGDGYFGTYSSAARIRALYRELAPAIVIGIGYPEAEGDIKVALQRRQYDLTPTPIDPKEAALTGLPPSGPDAFGGADAFLQVIEREIKPRVAAMLPVDRSREILFGHSLGGLFVLHTLFTHPDSFQTYLALSPSIWFNNRTVLGNEASFAAAVKSGKSSPRVFIGVGGAEKAPSVDPLPPGMTREQAMRLLAQGAMVDNAMQLGDRLKALSGAAGYTVQSRVFDGESHMSVGWVAVGPFLEFALPKK